MDNAIISRDLFCNSDVKGLMLLSCLAEILQFDQKIRSLASIPDESGKRERYINEAQSSIARVEADAERDILQHTSQIAEINRSISDLRAGIQRKTSLLVQLKETIAQRLLTLTSPSDASERKELIQKEKSFSEEVRQNIEKAQSDIRSLSVSIERHHQAIRRIAEGRDASRARINDNLREQLAQLQGNGLSHREKEDAFNNLTEKVPPHILDMAVASLNPYLVHDRAVSHPYLKQVVAGTVETEISHEAASHLSQRYTSVVRGDTAIVPYVLDRKYSVYQVFFHRSDQDNRAWEHFNTICQSQILLKKGFLFEFALYDTQQAHALQTSIPADRVMTSGEALNAYLDEIERDCDMIETVYLREQHPTVWEYLLAFPGSIKTRCIALWNIPDGLDTNILTRIDNIYPKAERCGISFVMSVNANTAVPEAVRQKLANLADRMNPLEYDPTTDSYRDLRAPNVRFHIHRL